MALELLEGDVHLLDARTLTLPTPCDGWTVRDLINHMNAEHVAICDGAVPDESDPRAEFCRIAARWVAFFDTTMGRAVRIPKMGADIPSEIMLSVHLADMVVHRWDLTSAIGSPCPVPEALLDAAAEVAEVATANGGPLVGPDGVYMPALGPDPKGTRLENLVRQYGRDHRRWR